MIGVAVVVERVIQREVAFEMRVIRLDGEGLADERDAADGHLLAVGPVAMTQAHAGIAEREHVVAGKSEAAVGREIDRRAAIAAVARRRVDAGIEKMVRAPDGTDHPPQAQHEDYKQTHYLTRARPRWALVSPGLIMRTRSNRRRASARRPRE